MWQIQMDHPVQRPITFQMRDGMNDFLRSAHAANSDMPTDVRALEDAVGVRLVSENRRSWSNLRWDFPSQPADKKEKAAKAQKEVRR